MQVAQSGDFVGQNTQWGIDEAQTHHTRRLRQREQERSLPHTPIVAMTANAMLDDRDQCMAAGMDDFIAKPFRADEVIATVSRHLGQAD